MVHLVLSVRVPQREKVREERDRVKLYDLQNYHTYFSPSFGDVPLDGPLVVFKLLNAFNHFDFILPVDEDDIFRSLPIAPSAESSLEANSINYTNRYNVASKDHNTMDTDTTETDDVLTLKTTDFCLKQRTSTVIAQTDRQADNCPLTS
ncbi:hypothetical protein J6590_038557 [Homalodisca vitripennis]|nr:hypothetical protein J6590_038557 [Homalodisca vitripennis]